MDYRLLGNSGVVVSNLALGTMTFGMEVDEPTAHEMLSAFAEAGGTLIDTADVYSWGRSEQYIGSWLSRNKAAADQMVVATKGRFSRGDGPNDLGLSRRWLTRALDASLTRLGVDHVDLYQLHAWDEYTPLEETLRFLDDAITDGKIGAYGLSNFLGYQLTAAVYEAKLHGFAPPVSLQPQYNLLVRGIEHEIVPAATRASIGLLPWSPLGGGGLSGKYERDTPPAGATRLGEDPNRGMEAWEGRNADWRTWRVLDAVRQVADRHGVSLSQVAIRWLLEQQAVSSVILGVRHLNQLRDNLAVNDFTLSEEDLAALSDASAPAADDYPYGAAGVEQRSRSIRGDGGR